MVLVLLTLYSGAAIGVPLHSHYCGGELQHVTLFTQMECDDHEDMHAHVEKPQSCCTKGLTTQCEASNDNHDGCCDDQSEFLQLDENAAVFVIVNGDILNAIAVEFVELPSISLKEELNDNLIYNLRHKPISTPF